MRHWWRQPDQYQWLSDYLAARHLLTFTRYLMAAIIAALGIPPILMLWSPAGPDGASTRIASVAIAASCGIMAMFWATRWPNRGQASLFAITSTLAIAVNCLVVGPGSGMQGCVVFAALAGYVAFFLTTRHLVFTLLTAVGTATACAVEIALLGDPLQAISKLLVLLIGTLAVPLCVQVMVHTLGFDALRSDLDSLTDLPNRRGFRRSVRVLATESSNDSRAHLTVVMVDLDDFKRVNDTAGHAAGDQILIAVGDILRRSRPGDSVVGRVGGEEFVVAMSGDRREAIGLAEHVRHQIAQTPARVTASIGVASASLFRVLPGEIPGHVDRLLESADRAMYKAKRSGGDRVYVVGRPSDVYGGKPTARRAKGPQGDPLWRTAERAPAVADTRNAIAASIDPTRGRASATPTRIPPEIVTARPAVVTNAKKGA